MMIHHPVLRQIQRKLLSHGRRSFGALQRFVPPLDIESHAMDGQEPVTLQRDASTSVRDPGCAILRRSRFTSCFMAKVSFARCRSPLGTVLAKARAAGWEPVRRGCGSRGAGCGSRSLAGVRAALVVIRVALPVARAAGLAPVRNYREIGTISRR